MLESLSGFVTVSDFVVSSESALSPVESVDCDVVLPSVAAPAPSCAVATPAPATVAADTPAVSTPALSHTKNRPAMRLPSPTRQTIMPLP